MPAHTLRKNATDNFHIPFQYIVSGSDDFNVYIWEVPTDWADHEKQVTVGRAFLVLHGHRSIVNQVRFNPASHMLLSAGVEKVVKVMMYVDVQVPCSRTDYFPVNLKQYCVCVFKQLAVVWAGRVSAFSAFRATC